MHIEIIAAFEYFLAIVARNADMEVLTLNVFVHVCGLVAGVVADGTAPSLPAHLINGLNHLALDYHVKLCISQIQVRITSSTQKKFSNVFSYVWPALLYS